MTIHLQQKLKMKMKIFLDYGELIIKLKLNLSQILKSPTMEKLIKKLVNLMMKILMSPTMKLMNPIMKMMMMKKRVMKIIKKRYLKNNLKLIMVYQKLKLPITKLKKVKKNHQNEKFKIDLFKPILNIFIDKIKIKDYNLYICY